MSAVLIVDDSPSDRALFRNVLTRAGYTVHEVSYGRETLAKAREVRPHAIVLDVNLPDMDGHSVCRAIRGDVEVAGIPVLMLTVRDNDADVLAGLEAGADDYVAKDADPAIVLARVRRLVQFRQLATVAMLNEHLIQVGRLLAGIVHEIRGPLSVIRGSAELMRLQMAPDDPNVQWIDPILRNAQLLQARLEHLMATVRSGPAKSQVIGLESLVHEAAELFRKGTDPRAGEITVDTELADVELQVRTDPGRLLQVLLSLFGNAQEAILSAQASGRIVVRTQKRVEDDKEWAVVEVSDDGPGIPEPILQRIFEPFFTTKETGSGYGLYLASEIVREAGGNLTARNASERGACFTVRLPLATPELRASNVA